MGFLSGAEDNDADSEVVALVVSELVTNAVRHAECEDEQIQLRVEAKGGNVRVEVVDHDPRPPTLSTRAPGTETDRGRGLMIVDRMSSRWGWTPVEGNGKEVWCHLRPGRTR